MLGHGDDVYSEDRQRYFRLASILHDEGQLILRRFFQTFYAGNTLEKYLSEPSVKDKLNNLRNKSLHPGQYKLLYPGSGDPEIDSFDISLLSVLIRALHPVINSDSNVWTRPLPGDLSAEADITRIRDLRNDLLGHSVTMSVEEATFGLYCGQLDMLFGRLLNSIGCAVPSADDMSKIIRDKKCCSLEPSTVCMLQNTIQLWQLQKSRVEAQIEDCVQEVRSSIKGMSNNLKEHLKKQPRVYVRREVATSTTDSLEHDGRVNVSTSTSSLQRTPSFRVRLKSFVVPFIPGGTMPRKQHSEYRHFLPKKQLKHRHKTKGKCVTCFKPFCCSVPSNNTLRTWDHSDAGCRCRITGIASLPNKYLVVVDQAHDSVQVFDSQGDPVDEVCYPGARAVCAVSSDTVAVVLNQAKRILLLMITEEGIKYVDEVAVECEDGWLMDIKYRNEKMYLLCDRRHVHEIDLLARTDLLTEVPHDIRACCLEVSMQGSTFFLGDVNGVHCINADGQLLWRFQGNARVGVFSVSGLSLYNGKLLFSSSKDNAIVELDLKRYSVRRFGMERLRCPLCLNISPTGRLYVSQYMKDLSTVLCSQVQVFRL